MKLLLILLSACMFAQAESLDLLIGKWVNEHETEGVTQVSVRRDGGRTIVQAWGACVPIDCDLGQTDADLWNGIPVATWNHGFATVRMHLIPLPDRRMIVAVETEYKDGSGRKDPGHAEFFQHFEAKQESDEAVRARVLLRQTADAYRNLPSAYFEAISTHTRTATKTEVRTVTKEKIFSTPPNKLRVEFDSPGESYHLIADGVSEWTVYPKANEYRTNPQAKRPVANAPLSRYPLLDNIRGDPKIVESEDARTAGCSMVQITMDHGVTEQLWIDNSTHLVRKDVLDEGQSKEEIIFTLTRLGEPNTPETFAYVQPVQTQKIGRSLHTEPRKHWSGSPPRISACTIWTVARSI
jgi:outer membrane lipoprotein-sorting protein